MTNINKKYFQNEKMINFMSLMGAFLGILAKALD
jgi:hypothetical protein